MSLHGQKLGFYTTIKWQTVNFSDKRNAIKVGDISVIDQEAIYARVIGLMVRQRELDLIDMLGCELAAYLPSMFHPDGSMRIATGKACLKNNLAVVTSVRVWGQPSVIVVDVSAVLWTFNWPTKGTVHTFVNKFKIWVANKLNSADVHLVLDMYYDYSTKSSTRVASADKTATTQVHKLSAKTPLPTRDAVLKCAYGYAYGGLGVTMSECRKRMWAQKSSDVSKMDSLTHKTLS